MNEDKITLSFAGIDVLETVLQGEDKRKRDSMKLSKLTTSLLASSFLLATAAFAGPANRGTVNTDETVTVGGKQLPAGQYQVEWAGSGSDVELSILNGKTTVAKVPAQILPLNKAESQSGYATSADQSGNKTLTEIFFSGKKYVLSIGEASVAASSDRSRSSN
jgi:hypothetical protein